MSRKSRKKQQVEDVKSNDLFAYHGPDPFKKHKEVEVTIKDAPEEDHNLKKDVVKNTTFDKYDLESWKGIRQQQADDKTVDPVYFYKDKDSKITPTYDIDNHPNDKYKFAILRNTENGKYLIGGLLTFELNGVTIVTQPNNVIFVDLLNKSVFIKEFDKINKTIAPEDPEDRQYIIMMSCVDDYGDPVYRWEAMTGRTAMYDYIVENQEEIEIDPDNSFILTENVPYKDALTVRQFIRYVKNKGLYANDGVDFTDDYEYY